MQNTNVKANNVVEYELILLTIITSKEVMLVSKKRRIINPNMVANPIILPDAKDTVVANIKDPKDDSHKVSLGPHSKR